MSQDRSARLLIVDDSDVFCWAMQREFTQRGYDVRVAHSVPAASEVIASWAPDYAVVDLRMPGPAGITLISRILQSNPNARTVMLTGYASIATAVEAIKLGATHYLVKPVDADTIERAFAHVAGDDTVSPTEQELSVDRLEWEHIQRVFNDNNRNVSATARALGMHRRTLQRKLSKRPVRR